MARSRPSHFSLPSATLVQAFSRVAAALASDGRAPFSRAARRSNTSAMPSPAWARVKCAWNCTSGVIPISFAIPR